MIKKIEQIKQLIQSALKAELKLNDVYEFWPNGLEEYEFFEIIFDDIERAVEHQPGILFSSEINLSSWINSEDYRILEIDLYLLNDSIDLENKYKTRKELIKTGFNPSVKG